MSITVGTTPDSLPSTVIHSVGAADRGVKNISREDISGDTYGGRAGGRGTKTCAT